MADPQLFQIPVENVPQSFAISLAGTTYNMTVKWNNAADSGWVMDIADVSNTPIACNIPMITGTDCLSGLEYLGIDGQIFVYTNGDATLVPTLDNFGTDCILLFQTTAANG